MRTSRRAATAAVSVSLALAGITAEAHADSTTVLYVNGSSTSCTDSGTGTQAAPYCTIQAAANAAVAGDTVDIAGGTYTGQLDIKSVGTASAPIVFQSEGAAVDIANAAGQTGPALNLDGASYVTFSDPTHALLIRATGVTVNGSSHVTLDGIEDLPTGPISAVHVMGTSSNIALTRSYVSSVQIDPGSSGDVISTNDIAALQNGFLGISIAGASNVDVTSNDVLQSLNSHNDISVSGGSTGISIENNIVTNTRFVNAATVPAVSVDASSASGTTLDYNIVYSTDTATSVPAQSPYAWSGVTYATAAALDAATGQGAHDLDSNPRMTGIRTYAPYGPQFNSANGSAPGMLGTDLLGNACTANPVISVTGSGTPAYCDRGAYQQQYSDAVTASATAVTALSVDLTSSIAQTLIQNGKAVPLAAWPTPAVSYTIAWGDGQKQTVQGSSTAAATSTTHTYAKAGVYAITDTANLTDGTTVSARTSVTTAGSSFTPLGPVRILDTRSRAAGFVGPMPSGTCYEMPVAGLGGIPVYASAVALNLTVTDTAGNGVFYLGSPTSSTLNYTAGQTVANSAIVPVDGSGGVEVCSKGTSTAKADVIVDATGYFARSSGAGYQPSTPDRILDTRAGTGAPKAKVAAKSGLSLQIVGADSIPAGVRAVALHVTETNATGGGFIAAAPDGAGVPSTSSLNYAPGQTISNTVIVPVAADGRIELYNGALSGSVDLIADVSGYFSDSAPEAFMPITPYRAVDTRVTKNALGAFGMAGFLLDTVQGIPSDATFAANLTETDATGSGHLTVYPFNTSVEPNISALNFGKGQTVANFGLFGSPGGADGVNVDNESTGSVDVIFDVFGYFTNS